MKFIKYSRYTGNEADSVGLDALMQALADHFLQSGFKGDMYGMYEMPPENSMEQLQQAIREAIERGDLGEEFERFRDLSPEDLERVIQRLMERMQEEGYITVDGPFDPQQSLNKPADAGGGHLGSDSPARFELTDKS